MKSLVLLLVVVVIAGPVGSTLAQTTTTQKQNRIKELARKFELFGRDPSKESSGVTYDELDAAYEDYKNRYGDGKFRASARDKSDTFRLLDDFVLTPMDFWRLSADEDDQTKAAYVKRAEKYYRLFWPGYVHGRLIGKKVMHNAKKMLQFLAAFEASSEDRPTVKMWQLAHAEYDALEQITREMVTNEDVYDRISEYGLLVNLFNDARVGVLKDRFFDRLDRCKSDEELLELQAEYKKLNLS